MEDSWHEKDKEEFFYDFKKSKEDWFMHTSPLNIKNPIGSFSIDTDPYDYDRSKRKDYPDLVVRTKTLTKEEFKREYPVEFDEAFPSNVKPKKSWLYRATQNIAKALLMLMTKNN